MATGQLVFTQGSDAVDSNKRCGALLFLYYLRLNQHLLAESAPPQKDLMVGLVEHLLQDNAPTEPVREPAREPARLTPP